MKYRIEYSPDAVDRLRLLTVREQRLVLDRVDRMLMHDPAVETRNRKPMRPNPLAPWELRIGSIRVYYGIEEKPECIVVILVVGIKERNRVRIGKEVWEL